MKIARGFGLPLDLVTEATAIVATRGAGKSSASAVIVEEGFALGVQVVVFDRTGVYWGLRSNAAGDGAGLPIYVLGGPHGDVPLEPNAGALIADLVVDSGHSFVLDLSDFSKANAIKFSAAFLERLYDRKARARTTTLLVIDEAHFYAPQTPRGGFKGDAALLMGAMEDVVGLGRSRGLGVVLTTQRTQALNKAVLDLIETLFVMRMLSPRAREAVRAWIMEKHEQDDQGVIQTLDSLPTGTAWVWSPLRGILEKVALRRIKTFDSYDTPKPGKARVEPTARKELDLAALGEQMKATAERAKENDPAELHRRIRDLQRQLASGDTPRARADEFDKTRATLERRIADLERERDSRPPERVPVLTDKQIGRLERVVDKLAGDVGSLEGERVAVLDAVGRALELVRVAPTPRRLAPPPARPETSRIVPRSPQSLGRNADGEEPRLKAGARRMLVALARLHPEPLTRIQLGTLADIAPTSGTYSSYKSALLRGGLIEDDASGIRLTAAGVDAADGDVGAGAPSPGELKAMWESKLKAGARRMLDVLFEAYPEGVSRDELAGRVEISKDSGTFSSYLSSLRRNNLAVDRQGLLYCGDALYIGER